MCSVPFHGHGQISCNAEMKQYLRYQQFFLNTAWQTSEKQGVPQTNVWMSHLLFGWPPQRLVLTEKVCDFIKRGHILSTEDNTHTDTRTHTFLTILRVALSCREMCNGKDKWRIKLRWQDGARVCECVCAPACVYCTTDQQTICSCPLNEQSKQQESRLSPNPESLYW